MVTSAGQGRYLGGVTQSMLPEHSKLHWPLLGLAALVVWQDAKSDARYWRKHTPSWGVPLALEASRVTGVPSVLLAALNRTESA